MAIAGNNVQVMSPFQERLASLPEIPRPRAAVGDGSEPQQASAKPNPQQPNGTQTADEKASSQIAPPPGKTLQDPELSETVKFQTVEQLMRSQDALARNRWAIDTHFRRIRSGVPFSRLEKIPNQSVWVQKLPTGMTKESSASVPNKADDLCNKVEDTLMADPAKPRPTPRVDEEATKQAGELAQEFLVGDGGEAGTDDPMLYRWALNNGFTAASSFLHYVTDRSGGGYQPLQKLAHPLAQDPQNPLVAMVPTGAPDPLTGQQATMEERTKDPIMRYISAPSPEFPAGQFVTSAEEADRVWLPKIKVEKYRRESVRCFPATAMAEEAAAIILVRFCTLAEARDEWPDTVGQMTQEELFALANWRPIMSEIVVPFAYRGSLASGGSGPGLAEVGSFSPLLQRRMFSYRFMIDDSPEYPSGYWLDVTGANGGMVLHEKDLEYVVKLPKAGKLKRCRDIPVVHVRPQQDVDGGDATGFPFISRFAGPSEAEQTLYAAFQDMCDNMLHPHVFLPGTQAIDEDDWMDRTRPIIYDPTAGVMPSYEQFPTLPPVLELIENMDQKMDTVSGLTATAQGLDSPNSQSGVAKNLSIRQALVSLSGIQQNLHSAMTRGWRIKCQIAQAEFTTPQLMQYSGDEGSSQPQWWTGEDMAGIDRIGIQPGTGTMMTPEGKAQYVAFLQGQQWMTPEEAAKVALPGIKMDLGIPENPYKEAIERAVALWLQGPTDEWMNAAKQQQQATEQADATAQQQFVAGEEVQQPAQQTPLPTPFTPRPNDTRPDVAMIYAQRLSELFVDPQYAAQPPSWQKLVEEAYARYEAALVPQVPMTGPDGQPMPGAPTGGVQMPKTPQIKAGIAGPQPKAA